jgi:3-hydroxyisobutyrate dehydrogenase-like beta-hydroxyacid dehydrogenase
MTMLADDAALEAVMSGDSGVLEELEPATLHISLSTISVATAERMANDHLKRGLHFLSAPVFGRPEAAAAGKLFIVAGGSDADFKRASPLFPSISQRVFYVGESPQAANLIKLCGNFLILSSIEAMGEAMALAQKGGVDKQQLLEILTGTLFDLPIYRNYGGLLVTEKFKPAGFAAPLGLKDMRLVGEAAETLRVPMPLLHVMSDHLLQTINGEGEDADWSAIGRSIAKNAGL